MDELLARFKRTRSDFLEVLLRFPASKRSEILFGKWSLKDLLAHLIGWDRYFIDILESLEADEEPLYWGNMTKFNEASVEKRSDSSWEAVHEEFRTTGEEFMHRYARLPEGLKDSLFWRGRSYTPVRMVEINIHHYSKSHLGQVKKALASFE